MAFAVVGTAFANATTISIPAHVAGDVIVIFAFRNDSATPPTRPGGYFALLSGASGTFSSTVGWAEAVDSSTVSGTWADATRLSCVVIRDGVIDEAVASPSGSSSSDDFYWGSDTYAAGRRVVLFGENNATYSGAAAHTTPSTNAAWTTIGSVTDQGSVIHLSDDLITSVDEFVSLTSSGGTPGYRTAAIAITPDATERTGTAAITLGAVTSSSAVDVIVDGEAAVTLGAVTSSSAVDVLVDGEATITLGAATLSATGGTGTTGTGTAIITLGTLTADSEGDVLVDGDLDLTLGSLRLVATSDTGANFAEASITLGTLTLFAQDTLWRRITPSNDSSWTREP